MTRRKASFLFRNGLSLVLTACFLVCIAGQIFTGLREYRKELEEEGVHTHVSLTRYLSTGHFIQSTFENWESEFLQMGMYVLLTIFLRQQGSSESKSLSHKEDVDREPDPRRPGAPWAVKKGGWISRIYQHSLSIAFGILFLISFFLHASGSLRYYNEEQRMKRQPERGLAEHLGSSRFWYESFQNWQSEFIAVISIVMLSIFLRQKGSPESKPVDASDDETKG